MLNTERRIQLLKQEVIINNTDNVSLLTKHISTTIPSRNHKISVKSDIASDKGGDKRMMNWKAFGSGPPSQHLLGRTVENHEKRQSE
jgi:hypothetical protein